MLGKKGRYLGCLRVCRAAPDVQVIGIDFQPLEPTQDQKRCSKHVELFPSSFIVRFSKPFLAHVLYVFPLQIEGALTYISLVC